MSSVYLRRISHWGLGLLLGCCSVSICLAQTSYKGRPELRAFTRDLPSIDKVELLKLKREGDWWRGEIAASKVLTGEAAHNLAALWRRQTYLPYMAACHFPGYAIKFYSDNKLLVYASLCWECNNIGFQIPRLEGTQSFNGRDKKGQQLLQIFRTTFHDSK